VNEEDKVLRRHKIKTKESEERKVRAMENNPFAIGGIEKCPKSKLFLVLEAM
jgi:hypothetical protein